MRVNILCLVILAAGCSPDDKTTAPAGSASDGSDSGLDAGDGGSGDGSGGGDGGGDDGGGDDGGGDDIEVGIGVGLRAPDFTLLDQHGEAFTLSELRGTRMVVFGSSAWCPNCQETAEKMQEWYVEEALDDQLVVAVLSENLTSEPPDVDDCAEWADRVGLTFPVLADSEHLWADTYAAPDDIEARRSYFVVDSEGIISWLQQDGSRARRQDMKAAVNSAE